MSSGHHEQVTMPDSISMDGSATFGRAAIGNTSGSLPSHRLQGGEPSVEAKDNPGAIRAITNSLRTLPHAQFKRSREFYLRYDGFYFVLFGALAFSMWATDFQPLVPRWTVACWIALPFVVYAHTLCSVFIHNASHANFPIWVNRIVGELCGVVVLSRFASWQIIHQRHHRFSDDLDKDPHAIAQEHAGYWQHLWYSIKNVERMLQTTFLELHGDTEENRRYEKRRAYISYGTNIVLLAFWYFLLGPIGFLGFYVPAFILGGLHVSHFNWVTHNAGSSAHDYKPVNLNKGIYRLGNVLFFGIYMHANHHRWVRLFNPALVRKLTPEQQSFSSAMEIQRLL